MVGLLRELPPFEYTMTNDARNWIVFDTHHDTLIVGGRLCGRAEELSDDGRNDRVDIDDRMATARLRNTLNLKWPAIEYRLHGLGLNGRRSDESRAGRGVESERAYRRLRLSVVPSHRITEVHKARNAEALADTIRRFLSAVEDVPVVSLLGLERRPSSGWTA